jgi:hypothetical protein
MQLLFDKVLLQYRLSSMIQVGEVEKMWLSEVEKKPEKKRRRFSSKTCYDSMDRKGERMVSHASLVCHPTTDVKFHSDRRGITSLSHS